MVMGIDRMLVNYHNFMTGTPPMGDPPPPVSWNPMAETPPTIPHFSPVPTADHEIRNGVPKILILSGLPGCGKTEYAKRWVSVEPQKRERVSLDELRGDGEWTPELEKSVKAAAIQLTEAAIRQGKSVIIDSTNLTQGAKQRWLDLAIKLNCDSEVYEFDVSPTTCAWRDSRREGKARVGKAVIDRMALFAGWIDWTTISPHQKFVVVDLDGVLCNDSHRQKYLETIKRDWDSYYKECINDTPNPIILDLLPRLALHFTLLVVSERPIDKCGKATEEWLRQHLNNKGLNNNYLYLFMANGGGKQSEVEIKQEICDLLPPRERIAFVLEDNPEVANMWRANGIECFQVADGRGGL